MSPVGSCILDAADRTIPKEINGVEQRGFTGTVRTENEVDWTYFEFDVGECAVVLNANFF